MVSPGGPPAPLRLVGEVRCLGHAGRPWSLPASYARSIKPLSLPARAPRGRGHPRTARRCAAGPTLDRVGAATNPGSPKGDADPRHRARFPSEHRAQLPQQRVVAQLQAAAQVVRPATSRRCRSSCRSSARPSPRAGPATPRPARRAAAAPRRAPRRRRTSRGRARPVVPSRSPRRRRRPAGPRRSSTCRKASHSVGSASRRRSRSRSSSVRPRNRSTKDGVLGAGEELQLAVLHATGSRWPAPGSPEHQEVLRRHRLEHGDLLR